MELAQSICWKCGNACTNGCSWSESLTPVKGWKAEWQSNNQSYCVISCPEFKEDSGKYELTIEGCHNLIAGMIKLAVADYRSANHFSPKSDVPIEEREHECKRRRRKIEYFLRSDFFRTVSDIDPDWLIGKLRQEIASGATEMLPESLPDA